MYHKRYKIADLIVELKFTTDKLLSRGEKYITGETGAADISICISEDIVKSYHLKYPQLSADEWEYQLTGFAFSNALTNFNGFGLHSSAVALDNKAIVFSAPSGIGKSTHTGLWQQFFGADKAFIINDDKPALRLKGDVFFVYGTPWSGKSELNLNIAVPLQAVVFLEQAVENSIRRLNNMEAVRSLIFQSSRPRDSDKMDRLLYLIDTLINKAPVYKLCCNVSIEAVETVYYAINSV